MDNLLLRKCFLSIVILLIFTMQANVHAQSREDIESAVYKARINPDDNGLVNSANTQLAMYFMTAKWHPPVRLDENDGSYGTMYYSPQNDLYAFYTVYSEPEIMKLRIRKAGEETFTSEVTIGEGILTVNPYFISTSEILLGAETKWSSKVIQSDDSGKSWSEQLSYPGTDWPNGDRRHGFITGDNDNLRYFFGYTYSNAVLGVMIRASKALQTNGVWPDEAVRLTAMTSYGGLTYPHDLQGAFEDNSGNILILASRAYRSEDSGENFVLKESDGNLEEIIHSVMSVYKNPVNNKIQLMNIYYYGTGPYDQHIGIWETSDTGDTWTKLATIDNDEYMFHGAIAGSGQLMALTVTMADDTELWTSISLDGGNTWTSLKQIEDFSGTDSKVSQVSMTASYNGRISLFYSLISDGGFQGVYHREFY